MKKHTAILSTRRRPRIITRSKSRSQQHQYQYPKPNKRQHDERKQKKRKKNVIKSKKEQKEQKEEKGGDAKVDLLMTLTDAIFTLVFEFLENRTDVLCKCSILNRAWKHLIHTAPKAWPRLLIDTGPMNIFVNHKLPMKAITASLRALTWTCFYLDDHPFSPLLNEPSRVLQELSFITNDLQFKMVQSLATTHPRLRRLCLTFAIFRSMTFTLPLHLETLEIRGVYSPTTLDILPTVNLDLLPALRSLCLENVDFMLHTTDEQQLKPHSLLTALTILIRMGYETNVSQLAETLTLIADSPSLSSLKLDLTDARRNYTAWNSSFPWPLTLTRLHLFSAELTKRTDLEAIGCLTYLQELTINMHHKLIKFGLDLFAQALTELRILQLLNRAHYPIFAVSPLYPLHPLSIGTQRTGYLWPLNGPVHIANTAYVTHVGISNAAIASMLKRGIHVIFPTFTLATTVFAGAHVPRECSCTAPFIDILRNEKFTSGEIEPAVSVLGHVPPLSEEDDEKTDKKQLPKFKVGDFVDAQDQQGMWYLSYIKRITEQEILIHYVNWADRWDEWFDIRVLNPRLAPRYTHTVGAHRDPQGMTLENLFRYHAPSDQELCTLLLPAK